MNSEHRQLTHSDGASRFASSFDKEQITRCAAEAAVSIFFFYKARHLFHQNGSIGSLAVASALELLGLIALMGFIRTALTGAGDELEGQLARTLEANSGARALRYSSEDHVSRRGLPTRP